MSTNHSVTVQALMQFALPLGTTLVTGTAATKISWSVTIRAQPPALPDVASGELVLLSMGMLRAYNSRITLAEVIESLANAGVQVIAVRDRIPDAARASANSRDVSLLALPPDCNLPSVERAINTLIVNQAAQLSQRALEIQRQLTRRAAENHDLSSLLQIVARATACPVVLHDETGALLARVWPNLARRQASREQISDYSMEAFRKWLEREAPPREGNIVASPLGHTTVLLVEKRAAGWLSLVTRDGVLDEFLRLVLGYGADVCAIELARNRAIALAVEQTRGDWVQMWLSGAQADDEMMASRARQAGFEPDGTNMVSVFRAGGDVFSEPLETLAGFVRDDMQRRQLDGAVGQYVDMIVALYPLNNGTRPTRIRDIINDQRVLLADRVNNGCIGVGISRPCCGLAAMREAWREARDALGIATELGERDQATYYGDLKLYQLLLALKEHNLEDLERFHEATLSTLLEHDERRQGEYIRTLNGFFQANGNLARAAKELDVHRNTLVYRLERINNLTNLDLDDAENRLILHLALKIQRVLATVPGVQSAVA